MNFLKRSSVSENSKIRATARKRDISKGGLVTVTEIDPNDFSPNNRGGKKFHTHPFRLIFQSSPGGKTNINDLFFFIKQNSLH